MGVDSDSAERHYVISSANQGVLSDRVKAAIKTALAMVLAYGVALSMDWDNADWAAFSVAFCTLSTVGESLNKGLLRLCGTFLGILATLTLCSVRAGPLVVPDWHEHLHRLLHLYDGWHFPMVFLVRCRILGAAPRTRRRLQPAQ